jgi:hypothetical protein
MRDRPASACHMIDGTASVRRLTAQSSVCLTIAATEAVAYEPGMRHVSTGIALVTPCSIFNQRYNPRGFADHSELVEGHAVIALTTPPARPL